MNHLAPHLIVAMIFFYSFLASVTFFSLCALVFPRGRVGRWIALPGLLSMMCLVVFLGQAILLRHHLSRVLRMLSHRPPIWFFPLSSGSFSFPFFSGSFSLLITLILLDGDDLVP